MPFSPVKPNKSKAPFFSRRDRIAIACISALILAGWGVRLFLLPGEPAEVRVIRGAVSIPAGLNQAESTLTPKARAGNAGESLIVDINTADSALLETLPMIGPVKAEAIVRYREEHGRFAKTSDIMKVNGIGPSTYGKIEKRIKAGGL
jgi:comEA protein